jgi:hypothetical protein
MGEPQSRRQLSRTFYIISNPHKLIILTLQFVFFIWKNLDLFIAMQQYLTFCGSIQRPSFKDVNGTKCQDQYPGAFLTEPTDIFNAMTKVKSPTSGVITTGLWPLDHESCYDWRHSTHKKSVWTQWIYMARIEKILVDRYRPTMFRKCPPTALIRETLAALLSPLCTMTIVTVPKGTTADKTPAKMFYWPDNIQIEPAPETPAIVETVTSDPKVSKAKPVTKQPAKFNVEVMRSEQLRREETNQMVADVTGIFRKLHATSAGLAVRGQKGFYRPLLTMMDGLEEVCTIQSDEYH